MMNRAALALLRRGVVLRNKLAVPCAAAATAATTTPLLSTTTGRAIAGTTDANQTICGWLLWWSGAAAVAGAGTSLALCQGLTPASVSDTDWSDESVRSSEVLDAQLPEFTAEQVAQHDGVREERIWMSYAGYVYDVTDFIRNHPGGTEKILSAAGEPLEPYWFHYRMHFASDLPLKLLEPLVIGKLQASDQEAVEERMLQLEEGDDPYSREPLRHRALLVHSDQPMNAEVPTSLLTQSYLTPESLFYIRHHHPVPYITTEDGPSFRLTLDWSALNADNEARASSKTYTLQDLQTKFKPVTVVATLQCSGNRRSDFNEAHHRTSGTAWGQGAISTAAWTGVRLSDLVQDALSFSSLDPMEHVRFYSVDGMSASIGLDKALSPHGDVIVAYAMNGDPLPREHGYPLRMIVPGYAAVRSVKWLHKIELNQDEAEGPWQRGLNYKILPPSVTDAQAVKMDEMPSVTEVSVFSGITEANIVTAPTENASPSTKKRKKKGKAHQVGDLVTVQAKGWAWAGGGRNIVRVDLSADDGENWTAAILTEGKNQRFGRAWAWTFWECTIPNCRIRDDGTVRLASKAVDMAFNSQPENAKHGWNVRGLGNNSWFRSTIQVVDLPNKK
jgi:sulfite oxidase